ncbi:MAG: hypothetical protein ACKOCD_08150 [Nitrospiraceae bacterium]
MVSILTLDDILRFKLADPAELTQIVRVCPQPLAPEAGAKSSTSTPPDLRASSAFESGLDFKPSMSAEASSTPRPLTSVAKASTVVPMVKRRRRRTFLAEVRHTIHVNKTWIALLAAMALLLALTSYFLAFFGERVDAYRQGHYEPKDEERRVYMQEKQRLKSGDPSHRSP